MAVRKTAKGAALKRWFKEKWVDVRSGKPPQGSYPQARNDQGLLRRGGLVNLLGSLDV